MQKILKWTPLAERRARSKIVLFHKIIKKEIDISTPLLQKNNRNTRNNPNKYLVLPSRTDAFRYSYFPSTILMWNALPLNLTQAPSTDALRSRLINHKLLRVCEY